MKACVLSLSTALLALSLSTSASAKDTPGQPGQSTAGKPTLAVNTLEARGITADEAATLTDVLRNELSATGKFTVMERNQMEEILKEQGFQQSGACTDQTCLVEIGQLLGAQQLAAGSIGKVGKAYSINLRIISVKTGQIVGTVSHSYTGPLEQLLSGEMTVVARKLVGMPVKIGERTVLRSRKPLMYTAIGAGVVLIGGGVAYLVLNNAGSGKTVDPAEVVLQW